MRINRVRKRRVVLYVLLVILGLAALGFSFFDVCPLVKTILPSLKINKTTIISLIRSLGPLGPLISMGLMVLHSFVPFPAEVLTIANGMVFGPIWGTLITWVGAMLGAIASFGLTRRYGRPFVAQKVSASQLNKIDQWVQHQGAVSLLLSRFIPLISFNIINYGAGLTSVSWWTFFWTTAIGILPITVMMVTMGNSFNVLPWWVWAIVLIIIIGTTSLITSVRKKKSVKT